MTRGCTKVVVEWDYSLDLKSFWTSQNHQLGRIIRVKRRDDPTSRAVIEAKSDIWLVRGIQLIPKAS